MNEFLKLKWRTEDLNELEPQKEFIKEDVAGDSTIFKFLERKNYFKRKKNKRIFSNEQYIPGLVEYNPTIVKSCLDTWQHEHCLNAIKLLGSGKDPSSYTVQEKYSISIYKELTPKILQENGRYQAYAIKGYQQYQDSLSNMRAQIYLFGKHLWEKNADRVKEYPQFFKEIKCFSVTHSEQDGNVEFKHTLNALELGTVARFTHPNLKSKCLLTCITLPFIEKNVVLNSKLLVSEDGNVKRVLETHNIDVVISLSSLKCLTDNSDLKKSWFVPVIVKEINVKENNCVTKKKVVFIDKPFSPTMINKLDLVYKSFKRLLRTNFCQYEGVVYPDKDTYIEGKEPHKDDNEHVYKLKRTQNLIHHNASYRIWNVKKVDEQNNLMKNRGNNNTEFNVLVRSKLDACQTAPDGRTLQPVVLHPKLERQLRLGANIATRSELAREWTSLFFTPFSNLYRVRTKSTTNEVICVEKCTAQKVMTEAHVHHDYKPHLGLGILYRVFTELRGLEPGNYLLQHLKKHEAFVAVMAQCGKSEKDCFDLHAEYKNTVEIDVPKDFIPIDVNFILPAFNHHKRMPGMFSPAEKKNWKQVKMQKKAAVKKQTKLKEAKKQKKEQETEERGEEGQSNGRELIVYDMLE